MKKSTLLTLILIAVCGTLGALVGYQLTNQEQIVPLIAVILTLIACGLVMKLNSASSISKPSKLKDLSDYRKALEAWISEETPFTDQIRIAVNQIDSLERKQKALRSILDDTKESPFLSTADDVERYVLANSKRVLNRVMIYDGTDRSKLREHAFYLQDILQKNAKVLSDFENLILEVSQIGDDQSADTPFLRELTEALRSVRDTGDENAAWEQLDAVQADAAQMQQDAEQFHHQQMQ